MFRFQASRIASFIAAMVTVLSATPQSIALDAFPGAEGAGRKNSNTLGLSSTSTNIPNILTLGPVLF